jgi:hypothetical protein
VIRALTVTVAVLACAAPSAFAETARSAGHCGRIGFEPQTDNVAADIHARGTSCRRARRIVRAVYNGRTSPFGYRCRSRAHDEGGLFYRRWVCTKNDARVTWNKF